LAREAQAQSTWALGHSYTLAAEALMKQTEVYVQQPTLLLLLHSLELYLKSFLVLQGATERELRDLGHDLVACMRACKEHGLSKHVLLRRADVAQVVRLNEFYSAKELEYFVPRAKRFGNIEQIAYTVGIVAKGVLGVVFHESWRALYREQPLFAMKPAGAT
jgi:hypothetical protein